MDTEAWRTAVQSVTKSRTQLSTAAAISDRGKSAPTPRAPQRPLPQVAAAPVAWLCFLGPCWAIETPHDPDVLCPSGFKVVGAVPASP